MKASLGPVTYIRISLPWAVIGHPMPRMLQLEINDGGCDSFTHFVSHQTATIVGITAVGSRIHQAGAVCTGELHVNRQLFTLDRPLAHRRLVHSPVSSGWAQSTMPSDARGLRGTDVYTKAGVIWRVQLNLPTTERLTEMMTLVFTHYDGVAGVGRDPDGIVVYGVNNPTQRYIASLHHRLEGSPNVASVHRMR